MQPLRENNSIVPLTIVSPDGVKKAECLADVVETEKNAALGMMGFEDLPDDRGMLFKRANSFWMRGVNFDLDIVYADKYGKVVETQQMRKLANPATDYAPVYRPMAKRASLALELPAGWCRKNRVSVGDRITPKEN